MKRYIPILLIVIVFLCSGLLRLNDLAFYNPDSARYIIWGNSIAQGKGWIDDSRPDPQRFVVNAPLYALLIAPVEMVFPHSYYAIKIYTLLFGIIAVMMLYLLIRLKFGNLAAVIGAALFAFNTSTLVYSTEVLSDAPFVCLALVILYLLEKNENAALSKTSFFLLVTLIACAALLREVGLSLVVCATVLYALRKEYRNLAIILGAAIALVGLWQFRNLILISVPVGWESNLGLMTQHFSTPQGSSLFAEFAYRIFHNTQVYGPLLGGYDIWLPLYPTLMSTHTPLTETILTIPGAVKIFIVSCISLASIVGVITDIKKPGGIPKIIFTGSILFFILLYPVVDRRFLFSLLPLHIYYFITGISWLSSKFPEKVKPHLKYSIVLLVPLLMLGNVAHAYEIISTNIRYVMHPETIEDNLTYYLLPWSKAAKWIDAHIPIKSPIAASNKDAVVFLPERKIIELGRGYPPEFFDFIIQSGGVEYVLTMTYWADISTYEYYMMTSARYRFELVHKEANIAVHKVYSRLRETPQPEVWSCVYFDSLSTANQMRLGWRLLAEGRYDTAAAIFQYVNRRMNGIDETRFSLVIANSLLERQDEAEKYKFQLTQMSQTMTWLQHAQDHLRLLRQLKNARTIPELPVRTIQIQNVIQEYWKMGYRHRAFSLMNSILAADSTYFMGYLWGWDYAMRSGDTLTASRYLQRLKTLDKTNPVVQTYGTITQTIDSLKRSRTPVQRSNYYLNITRLYGKIELMEEALDELQRSLGANPANVDALKTLAEYYVRCRMPIAAALTFDQVLQLEPENNLAKKFLKVYPVPY
jgi:tetratricopeptide (TPR) repeat protein/4-amino-4-deoxy-L-arabinose transferase-like glycosyltransferase